MKRRNFISKPLLRSLVRVSSESSTLMPRRLSTLLDDDQGKDGKNSPRRFSTLLEDDDQGGKDGKDSPRRFSTLHQTRNDHHDPFLRESQGRHGDDWGFHPFMQDVGVYPLLFILCSLPLGVVGFTTYYVRQNLHKDLRLSKHDKESFFRGETLSSLEKDEKTKSTDEKTWSEYFVDKKKHLLTGDEIDVWDDNDSSDSKKFFEYD